MELFVGRIYETYHGFRYKLEAADEDAVLLRFNFYCGAGVTLRSMTFTTSKNKFLALRPTLVQSRRVRRDAS